MKMITRDNAIGRLKEKGLKLTQQRLAILDVLVEQCEHHPGVSLIFEEARKKVPRVSLSTVYATLKEFSEIGLVKQLEFDRMENRYDGNLSDHVNLICTGCGTIADHSIPTHLEPDNISRDSGFVVTNARIEFHGYCRHCMTEQD